MTDATNTKSNDTLRRVMIVVLVLVAVFGAYKFASAQAGQAPTASSDQAVAGGGAASAAAPADQAGTAGDQAGAAGASPACACCGTGAPTEGGVTGPRTEGAATVEGGVQRIAVDVGSVYTPNAIKLKAGVPAEIMFSQAQGCTQIVESAELGFSEDLGSGPKAVKLKGLQPGTYAFSCGMQMVFGQIVVE